MINPGSGTIEFSDMTNLDASIVATTDLLDSGLSIDDVANTMLADPAEAAEAVTDAAAVRADWRFNRRRYG